MVQFNFSERTIKAKVVYYGPAQSGKTTNLEQIHRLTDPSGSHSLISLNTGQDRTLFFDLLPFSLGSVSGYDFKVQLYTVPGQVQYNATRRVVLAGADAVVFVADSRKSMAKDNQTAFENMKVNLLANRLVPEKVPVVLQWNKRDLPELMSEEEMAKTLNPWNRKALPAVAATGQGVLETFSAVVQDMLLAIAQKYNLKEKGLDPSSVPQLVSEAFAELMKKAAEAKPPEPPPPSPDRSGPPMTVGGRTAPGTSPPTPAPSTPSPAKITLTQAASASQVGTLQATPDTGLVSEELLQRAIRSNVELAEALSTLVHQMNQGLGSIQSHAELLLVYKEDARDKRTQAIQAIQHEANRMREMMKHLGDAGALAGGGAGTSSGIRGTSSGVRTAPPRPAAPPPPRPAPPPPAPVAAPPGSLAAHIDGLVAGMKDTLTARALLVELRVPPTLMPPRTPIEKLGGAVTSLLEGISTQSQGSTAVIRGEKKPVLLRGRDGSEVRREFLMLAVAHAAFLSPQEQQGVMQGTATGPIGDACRAVREAGGFVRFAPLAGGQLESRLFFPA